MPRVIRTARGEMVDLDMIIIKQQLAQAPMEIQVAQRKRFIDSKEERPKRSVGYIDHNVSGQPTVNVVMPPASIEQELEQEAPIKMAPLEGPVPVIPKRK